MALVNGRKVLRTEVDKYYNNQTAEKGKICITTVQDGENYRNVSVPCEPSQKPTDEQADILRLNILKQLVDNEILMQRAEKLGLIATEDEVNAKLAEIKAPFSQDEFDKRMAARNITLADFKADLKRSLTVDKVLNKEITSKINITDGDITSYYNQHKAEFNLIEPQFHLAQILVTTQPNPQQARSVANKAQNDADAKKKIQMIENRLDSGEDFGSIAMNFSEQPETAQNGGDLGFIPESSLKSDKSAFDAINKLKPGQYTTVLVVADPNSHQVFGYRVVRLISKEAAGQRELQD